MSVTCDRSVVISRASGFPYQYNWAPQYNWNVLESGVNYHQANKQTTFKIWTPSRSLSKVKYINICNGPPICHEVAHFVQIGWKLKRLKFEIFPFWLLLCQNSNGYIVMLYIFSESDFLWNYYHYYNYCLQYLYSP